MHPPPANGRRYPKSSPGAALFTVAARSAPARHRPAGAHRALEAIFHFDLIAKLEALSIQELLQNPRLIKMNHGSIFGMNKHINKNHK
jgi:hypothetical protein